jgi:hypothetical protein
MEKLLNRVLQLGLRHSIYTRAKIGSGEVVEIDECLFAKRKNHQGRMVKQQWVVGMVTRGDHKKAKFFKVKNRTSTTLTNLIVRHVSPRASLVCTDNWRGYYQIKHLGYNHQYVNHSQNFVNPYNNQVHTQTIEGLWRIMKRNSKKEGRKKLDQFLRNSQFFYIYSDHLQRIREFFKFLKRYAI